MQRKSFYKTPHCFTRPRKSTFHSGHSKPPDWLGILWALCPTAWAASAAAAAKTAGSESTAWQLSPSYYPDVARGWRAYRAAKPGHVSSQAVQAANFATLRPVVALNFGISAAACCQPITGGQDRAFCSASRSSTARVSVLPLRTPAQSEARALRAARAARWPTARAKERTRGLFKNYWRVCAKSIFRKLCPLNTLLNHQEKTSIVSSKNSSWEYCQRWGKAFCTFIYRYATWRHMYDRIITHCHKNLFYTRPEK